MIRVIFIDLSYLLLLVFLLTFIQIPYIAS